MTRIADRLGLRDEVDEFLASDDWVDLLEVVRNQLITGRSMGLKETAPLAGFAWRAGDSAGTLAMVKYDQAIDEETGPVGRGGGAGVAPRVQRGRRAGDGRVARVARRAGAGAALDRDGAGLKRAARVSLPVRAVGRCAEKFALTVPRSGESTSARISALRVPTCCAVPDR